MLRRRILHARSRLIGVAGLVYVADVGFPPLLYHTHVGPSDCADRRVPAVRRSVFRPTAGGAAVVSAGGSCPAIVLSASLQRLRGALLVDRRDAAGKPGSSRGPGRWICRATRSSRGRHAARQCTRSAWLRLRLSRLTARAFFLFNVRRAKWPPARPLVAANADLCARSGTSWPTSLPHGGALALLAGLHRCVGHR